MTAAKRVSAPPLDAIEGLAVVRVRAANPGPMTADGTETHVLISGDAAVVIDPGPDAPAHLDAIEQALETHGARAATILVTHAHRDHSAGAPAFKRRLDAPILGFGPFEGARSPAMAALAARGGAGGGEGVDAEHRVDRALKDGEPFAFGAHRLAALHTPGHLADHLCFALETAQGSDLGVVFTGDHVMGWSTSLVSPPDGDMGAYMRSLRRLAARPADRLFLPAHGALVGDPAARLTALAEHRRAREARILAALDGTPRSLSTVTRRAYDGVAPAVLPIAERNALAHLIDLWERGAVRTETDASPHEDALFTR